MRRVGRRGVPAGGGLVLLWTAFWATGAFALPTPVRLNTSTWAGEPARLSFELTSNNKSQATFEAGSVVIYDFEHDGVTASPSTFGAGASGDLVLQINPAYLSSLLAVSTDGVYFGHTGLGVNFDALGSTVTFSAELATYSPEASLREQASFYVLQRDGSGTLFATADPLGANALFVLDADDTFGTQLSVFAPAVLVPPDSVALDFPVVGVPTTTGVHGRLRLKLTGPNPFQASAPFRLVVPSPGMRIQLTIHDAAGRRVRRLLDRPLAAGESAFTWDGRDDEGRMTRAGVFWIVVRGEGQSVSRKLVRLR